MKGFQRLAAAAAAALTVVAMTAAPAVAAVPANDVYGGAVTVDTIPFDALLDTTGATTDADDADINATCGAPALDASVWYTFTPTSGDVFLADASQSDYSAGVLVATGSLGSFTVLACGPGAAAWQATAGETYTILVIDDQGDGGGNGGSMQLTVDVAPPPPELDVTVNSTAQFDSKTGSALLTGTVMCGADAVFAFLEVQLTQRVGRLLIRGFGGTDVTCDGTTRPWTIDVSGDNGLFKGGRTVSATFAVACSEVFCSEYFNESTIQLKGKR